MNKPRLSRHLQGIRCFACNQAHNALTLLTVCTTCGLPLRVDYDWASIRMSRAEMVNRPPTLWRYREVLPLAAGDETTLVEGFTPLLEIERNVWVKDEARNPTGCLATADRPGA